jgi:hypothetical protein
LRHAVRLKLNRLKNLLPIEHLLKIILIKVRSKSLTEPLAVLSVLEREKMILSDVKPVKLKRAFERKAIWVKVTAPAVNAVEL